ncbi:MAG: phenylacetate--CoA ligase family protein [Rhodospirillaceae bacterium]|nr:phenylacetate--CoA ligase family protein [Rhodospirillaceae bacterium]MDD9929590.1 phenylacetate--CoA ligase family protein [Rhodospirillaceae bacterium]
MTTANYFSATDMLALADDYPIGPAFVARFTSMSRDELRALQEARFQTLLARAWKIPFYQRHWGAKGIEPGDIRGLDDITKLPPFDKSDIMASIEAHPPFGDFHGMELYPPAERPPVVVHTTSGTTGKPQVLLYGPKSREVQNLLIARFYLLQGLRSDDIVHSVYGHGMVNGGHYLREAVVHWTNAIFLPAGTGSETRSVQQVAMMQDFGATVIVGFADYIKHLADVAREQGLEPGRDIPIRMISGHMGREAVEMLSESWGGVDVYDWYGVGDTGAIAGQGPDRQGLYVNEDAQYLEICDIETGAAVDDGQPGDMINTCLFKDDIYPIIRFNTHDVSAVCTDPAPSDLVLRRIEGFLGRSDNMIKLRGINFFPQAIGGMLAERTEFTGEFICRATRDARGRDELTVTVEVRGEPDTALEKAYSDLLRRKIGVAVDVAFAQPGGLASLTQIESRQKPIRLLDERFDGTA